MKRKVLAAIISGILLSSLSFGYSGGSGTAENPYQIADANDLLELAADTGNYDKCFILTADIDLGSSGTFTTAVIAPQGGGTFTGVFDGAGHKIVNLVINSENDVLGLFGYVAYGGEIKNLGLENVSVTGGNCSDYLGGLAGCNGTESYSYPGNISNCYSTGNISGGSGSWYIGGLVGCNYEYSRISNCYSTCAVSGGSSSGCIGGLVGFNWYRGIVINSHSASAVSGGDNSCYLGGLVGLNENGGGGILSNCYSTGTVTGGNESDDLGGLVGCNSGGGSISNCYSTCAVSGGNGSNNIGGLVGDNGDSIINCYAAGTVAGGNESRWLGGLVGENGGPVSNCYSTGAVSGSFVAGLVGGNYWSGTISNCYSTGVASRTGGGSGAGLVGCNYGSSISNCYFLDTSGTNNGIGTPLTDEQLKLQVNFVGWDFNVFWHICEEAGYPKLLWQPLPPCPPKYSGGSGNVDDPYQIANVTDLLALAANWSDYGKHFILMADIDLSSSGPFTNSVFMSWNYFTGVFDGARHKIVNVVINTDESGNFAGLFGSVYDGMIKNLGLENITITFSNGDYGIMGGGLVGYNWQGSITNCYSTGAVITGNYSYGVGGLVGYNYQGSISNCYSMVAVTSGNNSFYLGGLIGYNDYQGSVSNCYSRGAVTGGNESDALGGLVGYNYQGSISNCYSTGTVSGSSDVGALLGYNDSGTVNGCYYLMNSGPDNGFGTPLPDKAMREQHPFISTGWDFVGETMNGTEDIWRMCTDLMNYPVLWWQFSSGDFTCPDGVNFEDFSIMASEWLNESGQASWYSHFDIAKPPYNVINIADLATFCNNWLKNECINCQSTCSINCESTCNYNSNCEPWEDSYSCPDCQMGCNNNGICDWWENPTCPDCMMMHCNYNGICDPGEDPMTCPDCSMMRCNYNGICDPGEDPLSCPDCLMP